MALTRFAPLVLTLGALLAQPAWSEARFITVASTTSTEQSGLFGQLLPEFTKETGIEVRVVAVGTGQALDLARRGDADVVFVHDPEAEEKFVAEGFGVGRVAVMHNDFVLVGPRADPAKVAGEKDAAAAFAKLATAKQPFVSRADKSGTNMAELRLWQAAQVDIATAKGAWYKETGTGMGPALNTASSLDAYILTDRGTWLAFKNRGSLGILVEGDARLANPYHAMLVNPAKHAHVKRADGQAFIDWLVSAQGQAAIAAYAIGGQQLFFPDAVGAKP